MNSKSLFGFFCSILIFQPLAKAVEIPTKATFASVQSNGVIPIADQSVLIIPCAPVNGNCQETIEYLTQVVQSSQNLNPSQLEELNQKIREALHNFLKIEEVRTNLKGEVQLPCKVSHCLIYTNWIGNENNLFWINLHKQGTVQEYPPSKAIQLKNYKVAEDIVKLNESISTLKAQLSAGISYTNLSSSVAPFIQALEAAQNSPYASDYLNRITEAKRIEAMLSVLSRTWELYIKSTSVSGFITTHNVSCKQAKAIRFLWNEAVGSEDLGEIKGGFLGCLTVDLGEMKKPYGNTTIPEYMLHTISSKLQDMSNFSSQNQGTIPTISIPSSVSQSTGSKKIFQPAPKLDGWPSQPIFSAPQ